MRWLPSRSAPSSTCALLTRRSATFAPAGPPTSGPPPRVALPALAAAIDGRASVPHTQSRRSMSSVQKGAGSASPAVRAESGRAEAGRKGSIEQRGKKKVALGLT
jgi:hypothetical protein